MSVLLTRNIDRSSQILAVVTTGVIRKSSIAMAVQLVSELRYLRVQVPRGRHVVRDLGPGVSASEYLDPQSM